MLLALDVYYVRQAGSQAHATDTVEKEAPLLKGKSRHAAAWEGEGGSSHLARSLARIRFLTVPDWDARLLLT